MPCDYMNLIQSFFSLQANEWKMYLVHVLRLAHLFGAILIPFYLEIGKINFFQIMFLQAIFFACVLLLEVPTGIIADKIGRKHSIMLGFLTSSLAAFIYGSSANYFVFILAEIFFAIGFSFISGADAALIFDSLKELGQEKKSKKVLTTYTAVGGIGIVLFAPIGSIIAANYGLSLPLLLNSIIFFLGAVLAFTLVEPKRIFLHENYFHSFKFALKYLRENKILWIVALDAGLFMGLSHLLFWFYPVLLQKGALELIFWGFIAAGMNLLAFISTFFLSRIENFFTKKNLLTFFALIVGIGYLLAGLTNSIILLVFLIFVIKIARDLRIGLMTHYANQFISSERRATINSVIAMIRSLTLVIIYPLIGFGLDFNQDLTLLFTGVIVVIIFLASRVEERMLLN